ncbi:MAG: hypothetical protein NVSMB26_07610 [Beijerinckiaceae bacterium]
MDPSCVAANAHALRLAEALAIAWRLLVLEGHASVSSETADATRALMARSIVQAAERSTELVDLWMAGLAAVRAPALQQQQQARPPKRSVYGQIKQGLTANRHISALIAPRPLRGPELLTAT